MHPNQPPAIPSKVRPPPRPATWPHTVIPAALILLATLSPAAGQSASEILPVWREVFARPDTNLQAIPSPPDNPLTPAKIRLGQKLFHDTRLSGTGRRSCATCHVPHRAFTDGRHRADPLDGKTQLPNTPPLVNLAWAKRLFWDGRADTLEQQAKVPIEHPQEMAGSWTEIAASISEVASLKEDLRQAFPEAPSPSATNIVAAIASYERSLVSPPSRFDRFVAGDDTALAKSEQTGFALFVGKAGCIACHNGWRFTDDRLHRTGRSGKALKTPTLRALELTAPYLHDGSKASLTAVLTHYTSLDVDDRSLSASLVRPLKLSEEEKSALIDFLKCIGQ